MNIPSDVIWRLLFNEGHCPFIRHHSDFIMEEDRDELLCAALKKGEAGKKELHDRAKEFIIDYISLMDISDDFQEWLDYEQSAHYFEIKDDMEDGNKR